MEEQELMGPASDSESAMAAPWDPTPKLAAESTGSCKVMDPFFTIGDLGTDAGTQDEAVFPDSDDSELNRRRHRHRNIPDPLKKLLKKEISNLLDYLGWDLPLSAHIISFIKMVLKWKESHEMKRNGLKYKILVAREECGPKYPLVIASYIWKGEVRGSIYAPSYFGVQLLKEAFKYSKLWPAETKDGTCEWAVYPAEATIEFLAAKQGIGDRHYTSYPVHLYWMSPDVMKTAEYEIPREFKTSPLELKYVDTIDHYWGRHRTGSAGLIQQMILNNPTFGAFTMNEEFISWALQTHYGAVDIVHTVHRHRRKGTARSLLLLLALNIASDNSPVHAFAHRDDQDTKNFLAHSGFTFVAEYFYFYIDPLLKSNVK